MARRASPVPPAAEPHFTDYTVGAGWQPNVAVMAGQYAVNGGSTYLYVTSGTTAASGGPTGAETAIQDGTAVWSFNNA